MSILGDNYKKISSEIEQKISNPEEKEFVKAKMEELSMLFLQAFDKLEDTTNERIRQIEEKQQLIENKINNVESSVNEIENDIYLDDEEFDFEIVCPYCNNEFTTQLNNENELKKEIKCPECNNIIELDWNEEDENCGCSGDCGGCHGCAEDLQEDENDDDDM